MKTILLVDDEYALVEILTALFQSQGYRVVSAMNGRDGLTRLQQEKPDLVITDFMMPIADGRQLLRGMRALPAFRATPVVMMSSTSRAVALSTAREALEVAAFIRKPAQWDVVFDTVVRLIGRGDSSEPEG
jgi:CheY-like chemotaxis protein